MPSFNLERLMSPSEIAELYGGFFGEHPRYPLYQWQIAVRAEATRLGYWSWVRSQIDEEVTEENRHLPL
jgi:hypothetical protein